MQNLLKTNLYHVYPQKITSELVLQFFLFAPKEILNNSESYDKIKNAYIILKGAMRVQHVTSYFST